jgi:hypothetical protein
MDVNVQFADSSNEVVVMYFASPQDPAYWSNLGVVSTSDPRWKAFYEASYPQGDLPAYGGLPVPTTE